MLISNRLASATLLWLSFLSSCSLAQSPAKSVNAAFQPRADREVCGSETSSSGLITNYYCEGDNPVCCRDSSTTLEEGIPWNCIPSDAMCCGLGEYCSSDLICSGPDRSGYQCVSDLGAEVPAFPGNTPELEFDRSGVEGWDESSSGDGEDTGGAEKMEVRLWVVVAMGVWAAWFMV